MNPLSVINMSLFMRNILEPMDVWPMFENTAFRAHYPTGGTFIQPTSMEWL